MSLQSALNTSALNCLPNVLILIAKSNDFQANQIVNFTLREMINAPVAISRMGDVELILFELDLIEKIIYKLKNEWVNQ